MDVFLKWHSHRYFPYEEELARREVTALLKPAAIVAEGDGFCISGRFKPSHLRQLVYFGSYQVNGRVTPTFQHKLESSCTVTGAQKRQSTRYSVHGMHEYKGKFNPQMVRGMLNILDIPSNAQVFDPFSGSGTALVECSHVGMKAIGCDVNPLAVYISNAKLKALATPESTLRLLFLKLADSFEQQEGNLVRDAAGDDERAKYLQSWFDGDILSTIERLKLLVLDTVPEYSDIFLVLASNLLRDYSLQEPTDLRIRRRYTPYPSQTFWKAFRQKVTHFLDNLGSVQRVTGVCQHQNHAYLYDSRGLDRAPSPIKSRARYHVAITSPPYATALPYIDTQRLSLVWLGLVLPGDIGNLEAYLTGSREFIQDQKKVWQAALTDNIQQLPASMHEYCLGLQRAVSAKDGFRRQSVPALMYRYLSNMRDVFQSLLPLMRESAPFALIVGHNRTTLGGQCYDINTPDLLREIATSCGWSYVESIALQTYQRYSIHQANAVQAETLLIVRKP